jgi:hypothetical protein
MNELQEKLSKLHDVVNKQEELSAERDTLKKDIMELIKKHGLEDKQLSIGNRLIRCKKTSSKSLTQRYLGEALNRLNEGNPTKAQKDFAFIIENRPVHEVETLEILKKKS